MDCEENGESNVMCICKQLISKQDWQDHQIVCTKRRYTCPAYVSFISNIKSNEYSLPLVDSNCPPSLKEIAKLQVLQSEKENQSKWLESNGIPSSIIHTLKKECPTFKNKQELINHIENTCPYWKINCPMVGHYKVTTLENSHKEDDGCLGLSRQEFSLHLIETALDPISQKIRAISKIFPYHCKACDQYLLSSGIHICVKVSKSINKQMNYSEILCPGCKSIIRINSKKTESQEIENTCVNCHDNEMVIGLPGMIPSEHYEKGIVKWNNGTERTRVKWSLIKNSP